MMGMPPERKYWFLSPLLWIGLGLGALCIQHIAQRNPEYVESVYSRGIFLVIRQLQDLVCSFVSFPLWYLLTVVVSVTLLFRLVRWLRKPMRWTAKVWGIIRGGAGISGAIVFFFFIAWGYNYQRVPLEEQIGILPVPVSVDETFEELSLLTGELIQARAALTADTLPLSLPVGEQSHAHVSAQSLGALRDILMQFKIPAPGGLTARQLKPEGLLLRISTAGFYFPLTGECNIDGGLHPLQVPFVQAHEYAHGYGFGDEGTCNFLAYLALNESSDPWLRYSGVLGYWRYVASSAKRLAPERYRTFFNGIHPGVRQDLISIRRQMNRYPDLFPQTRDRVYSAYLQTQGIPEGLSNYSRVVLLAHAWRKKQKAE